MGSEACGYTRIFFKDKKNELKGPYTERQLQEWYRQGWFDSSFPFYFSENGSVSDDSPSFILGELCAHNGIGAPFSVPSESSSMEKIRAESEKKLDCFEEIFFKDKKNELKGPYTERQLQEWYRQRWFDSSFPFYFSENCSVSDDSPSFTLGELCAHNGIGAPFSVSSESSSMDKIRAESEQKLDCIEEEIRSLRVKLEAVLHVKERIEKMEEKIKSLPTQSAPSNAVETAPDSSNGELKEERNKKNNKVNPDVHSVEQRDKKREAELCVFNKWTDFYSDFYMAYLDSLRTKDYRMINRAYKEATSFANLIMKHDDARLMFIGKIIEKIKSGKLFVCNLCSVYFFNYKHLLFHLAGPLHIEEEKTVPNACLAQISYTSLKITDDVRAKWLAEDEAFTATLAKKYASVCLEDPNLRPTNAFLVSLSDRFAPQFAYASLTRASGVEKCVAAYNKWKNDGTADRMMAQLHEHIGSCLTCCITCEVVTGTREEYYRHVLLASHLETMDQLVLVPTIAINLTKKHLIE